MTLTLLSDLMARGVCIIAKGDALVVDAPADSMSIDDIESLRENKSEIVRLLTLASGEPTDDAAARLLGMDEVDPDAVPHCPSCGGFCDVQTCGDGWRCSRCDSDSTDRRNRTERLARSAARIRRYTQNRNG